MIRKKENFPFFGNWPREKKNTWEGENVKKERNSLRKQIKEIKHFLREAGFSAEEIKYYIMTLQGQLPPTSPTFSPYLENDFEEDFEDNLFDFQTSRETETVDAEVEANLMDVCSLALGTQKRGLASRNYPVKERG